MHLPQQDIHLFYKLHLALLFYANQELNILPDKIKTTEALKNAGLEKLYKVRDKLMDDPQLIDEFVKENPFHFSQKELDIILNWKHFIKGRFFITKFLKNYAVFLKEEENSEHSKAYGVKALFSPFEKMLGEYLPIMTNAVLIPFKEHIIYDGFLYPYNVSFGAGMRADINETYQLASSRFGIIESLPHIIDEQKENDAEKLKRYLKTESSRKYFMEKIFEMTRNNRELMILYHQEMGKSYMRSYKKDLSNIAGIPQGWFAQLQGIPVASGASKEDLEHNIKSIVPAAKQDLVYIFQIRQKESEK